MDKEDVVHIYNGILLSRIKEGNYTICRYVDGTVIQSEVRKRNATFDIAYMWNLKIEYK